MTEWNGGLVPMLSKCGDNEHHIGFKKNKPNSKMECRDYYNECTKLSKPGRPKELFGVWRIEDLIGRDHYARIQKIADFLVGIYVIKLCPSEHILKLRLAFNDESVDLLPVSELSLEEFRAEALEGKNCLPEPIPISKLPFNDIRVYTDYVKIDERYTTGNHQFLCVYDYNDESCEQQDVTLTWQNKLVINGGYATKILTDSK